MDKVFRLYEFTANDGGWVCAWEEHSPLMAYPVIRLQFHGPTRRAALETLVKNLEVEQCRLQDFVQHLKVEIIKELRKETP